MTAFSFRFPHIVSISDDGNLFSFDVRKMNCVEELAVGPRMLEGEGSWRATSVDFSENPYFVVSQWTTQRSILQAWSRKTGWQKWSITCEDLAERKQNQYSFKAVGNEEIAARDVAACTWPAPYTWSEPPSDIATTEDLENWRLRTPAQFSPVETISAVRWDGRSSSLVLGWNGGIAIVQTRWEEAIVLAFHSHWIHRQRTTMPTLSVGERLAAFNVDRSILIVDFMKAYHQEQGSIVRFVLPDALSDAGPTYWDNRSSSTHLDRSILASQKTLPHPLAGMNNGIISSKRIEYYHLQSETI